MKERIQGTAADEAWFRNEICWLGFLLSLLVVWVHSLNGDLFVKDEAALAAVQRLEYAVADRLGQIAVPGFFMISAYLFYRNFRMDRLLQKWSSRIRTILIPYLLWNFLYYAAYGAVTRIPAIKQIIGKPPVPLTAGELAEALLYYRYNPVFWYLFQLILLILLAPVLYMLLRHTVSGLLFLCFLIWGLWKGLALPWLNLDALFYYSAAAYLALGGKWLGCVLERRPCARLKDRVKEGAVLIIILSVSFLILQLAGAPLHGLPVHTVFMRLWGVCGAVGLIRLIPLPPASDLIKNSFFLYAVHFPWVRLFNKCAALILPHTAVSALVMFALMPVFIIITVWILSSVMKRILPGAYSVLSGGRGR